MTASSPVTMQDLVDGLKFTDVDGNKWRVVKGYGGVGYNITFDGSDLMNAVNLSSDGLTVTFGDYSSSPTFTSFTFNA